MCTGDSDTTKTGQNGRKQQTIPRMHFNGLEAFDIAIRF